MKTELILLLKENKFLEDCEYFLNTDLQIRHHLCNDGSEPLCRVPNSNEQVIDWILKDVIYNSNELDYKEQLDWLLFWYNNLLKKEFSLIGEFIYRLEEFFENSNLHIVIDKVCNLNDSETFWKYDIAYINNEDIIYELPMSGYKTKKETKHKAILDCFNLLKNKIE